MAIPPDPPGSSSRSYTDGRDELNLADFPISVLRRQQPEDEEGRKVDQIVYESSTYDPTTRRRVPQRVTLTTSTRHGLPTPADENVILALLWAAKRTSNFTEPRVYFSPHQLFQIMRWATNSRSYGRLSRVLLRLKALTILYENAWWDLTGRKYEEEFATGIIAEYRLVKTKVRRKADDIPPSYVHWTPQFFKSLTSGNLKKLNLDQLFSLNLPTAQRMYRFLDKRFYNAAEVEFDLRDFACGHLGMTQTPNVAEIKRRLAPSVAELEQCGFIEPAPPESRYLKVQRGVWRVRFRRSRVSMAVSPNPPEGSGPGKRPPATPAPEVLLVAEFYRVWAPETNPRPTETELAQARELIARHGEAEATELLGRVVILMRAKFPDAKRFGASLPYFEDAAKARSARRGQEAALEDAARRKREERKREERERADEEAVAAEWQPVWERLDDDQKEEIRSAVLRNHPYLSRPLLRRSSLALRLYLEELARRSNPGGESRGLMVDG